MKKYYAPQGAQDLAAVVADGFHRAAFHGFLAKLFLIRRFGLLVDVRVAAIIVAAKVARSGFAAEIAVDTLIIDIEFARKVFGIAVCDVCHKFISEK